MLNILWGTNDPAQYVDRFCGYVDNYCGYLVCKVRMGCEYFFCDSRKTERKIFEAGNG